MQEQKKARYETPTIQLVEVELEQGIAAGSTTIDGPDPVTPEIEDWKNDGFEDKNFDL